jgi:hypothetical protein
MLFYLGLGAWVNGGTGRRVTADYADRRRSGKKRMSQELDNPRVLKRLAWSILAALLAAGLGGTLAMTVYPLVVSLHLKFFIEWGAFLWIELGALICAMVGFMWTWRKLMP